ncbi:hypothetical protein Tco_0597487 [Tanacetum coccineum]
MGDENLIRTLGDYSKRSHEGYKNTIELPVGNNVVPIRSDTIRLVQNRCSFYGLWSKDPNNSSGFRLKHVDSLTLDGKRLSHLRTQIEQQQDDMIGKINLLWKTVSEKLNNVSTPENARNSMASKSIEAISHAEKEELRKNGIKSLSKLFSPKYLSLASIKELNKNLSALKRVHFVNSIIILSKDSDIEKEDVSSINVHEHDLGNMMRNKEEVKEKGKEEDEMETDEEVEEVF